MQTVGYINTNKYLWIFAFTGARVIMACRDTGKAEEAAKFIRSMVQSVEGAGTVEVVSLNLGSFASVRRCAQELLQKEEKIHLLVNNAGILHVSPVYQDQNVVAFCPRVCERPWATQEPEPTQHSKPTFVWAYIARHVWLHLIRHKAAGYTGTRTDTTQQTNICLGIHRQTRVAYI